MFRSLIRCAGATTLAGVFAVGMLLTGRPATAQTNDWTLVTTAYECPPNFTGPGTLADCGTTVPEMSFTLQVAAPGEPIPFVTDDTGSAMVEASGAELGAAVTIELPADYVSFYPVCTRNDGEDVDMQIDDEGITINQIAVGDVVYCDWFLYGKGSTPLASDATPEASGETVATPEPAATIEAQSEPAEPVRGGRAVKLFTGDCDSLGDEVIWFNDLLDEQGEPVGDERAIPAAASVNWDAEFSLNDAITDGYAIAVFANDDAAAPLLACGELGGVDNQDGTLSVGIQQVDNSGVAGTALFSYSSDDHATANVIVVISDSLVPTVTP